MSSKSLRIVASTAAQPDVTLDDLVSEIKGLADRALSLIQEHPGRRDSRTMNM
jgi:hypothetical protein